MTSKICRRWNEGDRRYARAAETHAKILNAAQRVFIGSGYERTSMDAVAQEAGVSKMTVYRQFKDKKTLFIACMNDQCWEMLEVENYSSSKNKSDASLALVNYAHLMVNLITDPDIVKLYRMLLGEINHFDGLGEHFYFGGPYKAIEIVERILYDLVPPERRRFLAQTFFWACLADTYERVVLGVLDPTAAKPHFANQIAMAADLVLEGVSDP